MLLVMRHRISLAPPPGSILTDQTGTVKPCPLCGDTHLVPLQITTGVVMQMIGPGSFTPRLRQFTIRVFCPKAKAYFDANFELEEYPSSPIKSVTAGEVE